jgi:aldose sugar dehydrogenase
MTTPRSTRTDRPSPNLAAWSSWHLLSVLVIGVVTTEFRLGAPLWQLPPSGRWFVAALVLTHVAAAAALWWQGARSTREYLTRTVLTFVFAYGALSFGLLLLGAYHSRSGLLVAVLLSLILTALPGILPRRRRGIQVGALALAAALLMSAGLLRKPSAAAAPESATRSIPARSNSFRIHMTVTEHLFPPNGPGGAVQALGAGYLLAAGDGTLRFLEEPVRAQPLQVKTLPYRVPLNRDAFERSRMETQETFRLGDLLVEEFGERLRLIAAHHYWFSDAECFVLRLSLAEVDRDAFLAGSAEVSWQTIFDTEPCLRLRTGERPPHVLGGAFSGNQLGGRLARLDERTVLMTVGDHGFDGWNGEEILAQRADAHYGKVVAVELSTGAAEIYSMGHRNPQGLAVTPDGRILAAEHGPQGGDELNLIERGRNYGWPYETYGVQYGLTAWPLSDRLGGHEEFTRPLYAWVPSVGISSVIALEADLFPGWQGDALVGSLGATTLFRLRLREGRVIFAEPIFVGWRVRDLVEGRDGRIVLLFDGGAVAVLEPAGPLAAEGSPPDGAFLFASCQGCHRIETGSAHGIGPDLKGVYERPIAAAPDFAYSTALRGIGGRWTRERLDAYLADPHAFAPGTTMEFPGIADPTERLLLISYLRALQ